MARTISATVGLRATNREADVLTIQDMLNKVPADQGRPKPSLKLDSRCGNKTTTAIQKFQLLHFGWPGADGRVNPGRETLAKLNELQPGQPVLPVPPLPAPPQRHTHFVLHQPGAVGTILDDPEDFFVRVLAGSNDDPSAPRSFHIAEIALFWMGQPGAAPHLIKPTAFRTGGGVPVSRFQLQSPGVTLQELNCPASYLSREMSGGKVSSTLTLFLKPTGPASRTGPRIKMHRHLGDSPHANPGPGVSYFRAGQFQFVRKLEG